MTIAQLAYEISLLSYEVGQLFYEVGAIYRVALTCEVDIRSGT